MLRSIGKQSGGIRGVSPEEEKEGNDEKRKAIAHLICTLGELKFLIYQFITSVLSFWP